MSDVLPQSRPRQSAKTVHVALGARAYDIHIGPGLLESLGQAAAARGARKVAVVTDENVGALYLQRAVSSLEQAGLVAAPVVVPAGEASKSFPELTRVCEALLEARIERGDLVVALGGGVVGDLAGFAAAIVRRGVRLVQMPTSLLAQVDSAVGGKTGINSRHGKNLIGAFLQPSLVLADTALLDTLPEREFRAGYAEVIKYGLINDTPFFDWLENNRDAIASGSPARIEAIAHACKAKADIVVRDERETGERALLNLGHTFAHALETAVAYDSKRLVHGEAVAIGLVLAFDLSVKLDLCPPDDAARVRAHVAAAGLPVSIAQIPGFVGSPERLTALMAQDKKVVNDRLTFILARGIGKSYIAPDVSPAVVTEFLTHAMRLP